MYGNIGGCAQSSAPARTCRSVQITRHWSCPVDCTWLMKKSYLTHTRQTHPSLSGTPYTHSASLTGGVAWTRIRLPVRLAIHVRRSRSSGRSLRSIALALILRYVGIVLLRHSVVAASVFSRLLPLERGVLPPGGGGLGQRLHARMGICRGCGYLAHGRGIQTMPVKLNRWSPD